MRLLRRQNGLPDRLNVRAAQIVENFGVIDAAVDDGVAAQVQLYQEAITELA